ncbi:RNase P modulator RnpM [Tuberibacillus calidus]|jgi:hypothetical protein|uniref:RNase P modulator RnpM n=1 Tax=Tuberibacillus calidus TaxID=340097 RepID=UPI0004076962|nr:YlxR family protein [Tuberibacillus calidus]
MKQRKVPIRKCIACGNTQDKRELFRIVRSPEGEVSLDPTGKKNGRGAYLSKDKACIEKARKKNLLAKHLNVDVDERIFIEMLSLIGEETNGEQQ